MRFAVLAVLAAALLLPTAAAAQSAPFAPLPQAQPDQTATVPVAATPSSDSGGISSLQETALIAGGVLLVLATGVLIARDARRNAPADPRPARPYEVETVDGVGERRRPAPRAAQRQKAAAKRARQARKRNRPVRK